MDIRKSLRLDPDSALPVYAQIEEQMARLVMTGGFRPGEQIPSVRELAILLRVNPLTVSKAYARLSERGIVETQRGRGVFVPAGPPAMPDREKEKVFRDKLDLLLAEAGQMGFPPERLLDLLKRRMRLGEKGSEPTE
jgi:GntR family transcriptional regulator